MGLFSKKKEASGVCDICSTPTSTSRRGKVYTIGQVRRATNNGFNGMASGVAAAMFDLAGIGNDESAAAWKQQVMKDSTDYLLCPECQARIDEYI